MNPIFQRTKYLSKILPFVGKNVIKVLIGQRRSGKSYTLLSLIQHLKLDPKEYIYINKEDLQRESINSYQTLHNLTKDYQTIFIDEVQEIHDWEKAVRSLRSQGKDIYITGSNSQLLSGELASSLSGRYVEISIYPLDRREFLESFKLSNTKENFLQYLEYWGLPYLLQLGLDENSKKYAKDIFNTIVLKDIIKRYRIRNVDFFEWLIQFLAQNIGSIFSSLSLSNFLANINIDINPKVINEYLNYANKALFLHSVERYDIIWKKLFERKSKHYFTDIGLKHAVYPYTINDIGKSLENLVYSNLIANDRKVTTGDIANKEIDFIAEKNGETIYIQVAYLLSSEETIKREFWSFEQIKDNRPKYVISLDDITGKPINGVIQMSVWEFLEKYV